MSVGQLNQVANICERMCNSSWLRNKVRPLTEKGKLGEVQIADLFSGAGGMTLGAFEAATAYGYKPSSSYAVDIDPSAIAVYKRNFLSCESNIQAGDLNQLLPGTIGRKRHTAENQLIRSIGEVNVLLAGPPCQGHSDLNNHTRRTDMRNLLYLKAIRFAELLQPKVVIIENVRSVTLDSNQVVKTGFETLRSLGYHVQEQVINISSLGLPQLRKRHILLATDRKIDAYQIPPRKESLPCISAVIGDLVNEDIEAHGDVFKTASKMTKPNLERANYLFKENKFDLPNDLRPPCHKDKDHSYVSMYGRLHWDKPAQTITSGFGSPGQGRYIHPLRERVITPHEAARIQGFPDYFSFEDIQSRVKLQRLIGNAVPPILTAALIEHVILQGGLR